MSERPPEAVDERPEITRAPVTAFVIGLVAGIASALLGIGGGLLMVPAMVLMLRIRQHRAVGTSLAVIFPTAIVAAWRYHLEAVERHTPGLQLPVILWLAIGGVAGATVGAKLANAIGAKQLRRLFGVFVIIVGMWMVIRVGPLAQTAVLAGPAPAQVLQMIGIGVLVGVMSGLLGVGGGLVMVPALVLLLAYPQHQAQGTSLAVIIPVSVSGVLVHMARGNVVWSLAPWLAMGASLGAWLTAGRVFNIPQDTLRTLFGLFLTAVGVSMVMARSPRRPAPEPGPAGNQRTAGGSGP